MLPRLRSQPGVLVAVLASIALAATLLATGPVLATAVAEGGLRADLAAADPAAIGIEVEVRTSAAQVSEVTATVEDLLASRFGELVAPPDTSVRAGSVRLVGQPADVVTPVAVADVGDGPALLAPVRTGGATGAALPVRIHEDALVALGADLGDVLTTSDGAQVQVAGTVAPVDPTDRRWWDDRLGRDGVAPGVDFTRVGPLYVEDADDLAALLGEDPPVAVRVRTLPVLDEVTPATLSDLAERAAGLPTRVDLALRPADVAERWQVRTPLADAAAAATVSLAATRAAVVATVAQVAVLAIYTLGLAGRLLRSGREVETMLLRARGATPEQLGRVATLEGLVLVVPAVLAAPWLATLAVRGLDALGVTGGSGLALAPVASPAALGAAAVAGVACLVVLVVPAVASARRTYASAREARGRRSPVGVAQELGLDLALVAVAGLGIWQLRITGAPLGGGAPAGPGDVDPVLVLAPALGLLAGALLVLRLVPAVARGGELLAHRVRGLVAGLGGWQLARRPDAVARPTLLLVLGVAVGVLAATYGTTWRVSQEDQAEVAVGADLVVRPDQRPTALPHWRAGSVLADDEEVARATPVWEGPVSLVAGAPGGTLFAVDAAAPVLAGRADTRPSVPVGDLDVPPLRGLRLPAGDELQLATELAPDPRWPGRSVDLSLVVRDGHGLTHLLPDRAAPEGVAAHSWPLAGMTTPVDVVALRIGTTAGSLRGTGYAGPALPAGASFPAPVLDLAVAAPRVDGTTVPLGDGWVTDPYASLAAFPPVHERTTTAPGGWRVQGTTGVAGARGSRATLTIVHEDAAVPSDAAVPAVVHPDVLTATGRDVGEDLLLTTGGAPLRIAIAGTMPLVPGAVDAPQPLLVDLDAVATARWTAERDLTRPSAWYVELEPAPADDRAAASRRLAAVWGAPPVDAPSVRSVAADEAERRGDPIAVGLVAALTLGALAAAALAVLGTVTTAVVGVRERAGDFALLQALGTSLRQLRWWLATEIAVVVAIGVVAGGLLGAVLVWAVLPTVALAADGSPAVPAPVVVLPARPVLVALAGVVGAFTLVPVVLTRVVARAHVAEVLRLGEDT